MTKLAIVACLSIGACRPIFLGTPDAYEAHRHLAKWADYHSLEW